MGNHLNQRNLVLVGGGGHASVVREAAELDGWRVLGYFDDQDANCSLPRLGKFFDFRKIESNCDVIFAIGNLETRKLLVQQNRRSLATVVHPSTVVSKQAVIGAGSFVAATAVVNPHSEIDQNAIINTRAVVEHHCTVGANCHIGPGAVLAGGVTVGENTLIGICACVNPNVRIGRDCVVGAGAVVTNDVADGSVVVGIPARPIVPQLRKSA